MNTELFLQFSLFSQKYFLKYVCVCVVRVWLAGTQNIFICPICFCGISSYNMGYIIVLSVKLTNKMPLVPFCARTFNNRCMTVFLSQFIWFGFCFRIRTHTHKQTSMFPKLNRLNWTQKFETGPYIVMVVECSLAVHKWQSKWTWKNAMTQHKM